MTTFIQSIRDAKLIVVDKAGTLGANGYAADGTAIWIASFVSIIQSSRSMTYNTRTLIAPLALFIALVFGAVANQAPAPGNAAQQPPASSPEEKSSTKGVRLVPSYSPITIVKRASTPPAFMFAPQSGEKSLPQPTTQFATRVTPGMATIFDVSVPELTGTQPLPVVCKVYTFDNFTTASEGITFTWGAAPQLRAWGSSILQRPLFITPGESSSATVTIPLGYSNRLFLLVVNSVDDTLGTYRGIHALQTGP